MYKVVLNMKDGTRKDFYSDDHFNTDGGIVYWHKGNDRDDLIAVPESQINSFEEIEIEE